MEFCRVSRHQKLLERQLMGCHSSNSDNAPEDLPKTFLCNEQSNAVIPAGASLWVPKLNQLIGNTPIVDLTSLLGLGADPLYKDVRVVAKCEFLNPGMSLKDRVMWNTLKNAVKSGKLGHGMTVISILWSEHDDTGTATAMVCAMQDFACKIIVQKGICSETKLQTIKAYGAEIVEIEAGENIRNFAMHYINQSPGHYYFCDKYNNPSVGKTYSEEFGPEIMAQLRGKLTHFVSCDKTGAVLQATGTYLKQHNESIKVVLAQSKKPDEKCVENFDDACDKRLRSLSGTVIDERIEVTTDQKHQMCLKLAKYKGVLVGLKSGANVHASLQVALNSIKAFNAKEGDDRKQSEGPRVLVCTTLPDVGLKFLKTVFNNVKPVTERDSKLYEKPAFSEWFKDIEAFQVTDLIGGTPLIDLSHLITNKHGNNDVKLLAKVEFFNPGFSIKDRIARNVLEKAEKCGKLCPGGTVVAASSGNTGAATAMFAAINNYKCVITTSPKCSKEKIDSIKAYGADVVLSPPGVSESHPKHYMNLAKTMAASHPSWFDFDQYYNPDNPESYEKSFGPEIIQQTHGKITTFVCAGSTGGTMSGTAKYLKRVNPAITCILGDPTGSIFHKYYTSGTLCEPGKFLVEGVGKGSIPGCMDMSVIDQVVTVEDKEAFKMCDVLARKNGLLVGGSSGLNISAALKVANESQTPGEVIVTVMPDSGIKYQSKIFNDKWLQLNNVAFERT